MKSNSDEDKQIDLFPVSKKEQNNLEKYISSKQIAHNKAKEEKIYAEKEAEVLHHELSEKIYDYIETNKSKISPPVFKIREHKKATVESGFIHLWITAPKFVKPRKKQSLSNKEQDFCADHLKLPNPDALSLEDLALFWYGHHFYESLDAGFMGMGQMGLTHLIGGIEKDIVNTWKYVREERGLEDAELWPLGGPHDTYTFCDESYYIDDYAGDHSWAFNDGYDIDYKWTYPWFFTIFEDSIEEAGEKFLNNFLDTGPEYYRSIDFPPEYGVWKK